VSVTARHYLRQEAKAHCPATPDEPQTVPEVVMRFLLALIDNLLADVRDSRLSQPRLEYTTLAPVWVMPMVRKAENTATHRR